ncbi:MAG: hypothetical protein WBA13_00465 [Microcoleaceae cyanobacterium]
MSNTIQEHLIYIHGVSQDNNQSHESVYNMLHQGVEAVRSPFPNRSLWDKSSRCDVEWGWNYHNEAFPDGNHLLAEAQDRFAEAILPEIKDEKDITWNPLRMLLFTMRTLMIKGFSDMFYYASRDGKSSIRATVASQIMQCIKQPLEEGKPISLTLMGHSAGSVVAFDFLFYLFAPQNILKEQEFIETQLEEIDVDTLKDFEKLRHLAENKKLRIRRLITFGSPISMLAFRSNAVVQILANGGKLNPSHYGLDQNHPIFGSALKGPRWVNFWDKDDIISWPVEPLMQNAFMIKDIYADVGDRIATAHNEYWDNKIVHENIAEIW